jgi:hypothetical protein
MSKQNEHGKLIAAAAKAALLPLGCRRKGQSRCWYSDERFWYIFIEFSQARGRGEHTSTSLQFGFSFNHGEARPLTG